MATPGKATKKEKKKPVPVKTSLNNPYDLSWKPLEKGHARFILKTVTEKFGSLELRKSHVRVLRKYRRKRKKKKGNPDAVVDAAEPARESEVRGWSDKRLRNDLAIGINEVTKGLEKNELDLVLVCDSVKPAHMTSHLIPLSQTRSVPACQVPCLSSNLAETLGLTSVLALGFKRQSSVFADTITALVPKVPPLSMAWLPRETGASKPEMTQLSAESKQQQPEGENVAKGKKRKLQDCTEVKDDPVTKLQALKVKKIIPNPSKPRKLKINKRLKIN